MSEEYSSPSWFPERNAGFVADLGVDVMDLLAPQAEERILDLRCGLGFEGANGNWNVDHVRLRFPAYQP